MILSLIELDYRNSDTVGLFGVLECSFSSAILRFLSLSGTWKLCFSVPEMENQSDRSKRAIPISWHLGSFYWGNIQYDGCLWYLSVFSLKRSACCFYQVLHALLNHLSRPTHISSEYPIHTFRSITTIYLEQT